MKHIWSVICQKSLIDSEANNISLIDCLEEIQFTFNKNDIKSDDKKIIPFKFHLVGFWEVEKEDKNFEIKIEIIDPDKKLLSDSENKFSIEKNILRFRSRIIFEKIPITTQGRYIFKIWQKNKLKNKYELVSELPLGIRILYKLNTLERK
jgi:hypothetical protein